MTVTRSTGNSGGGDMAKTLSGVARRELIDAVRARYRISTRAEKRLILKEFSAITGYHRKSAIRVLNQVDGADAAVCRAARPRVYDEAFRRTLVMLWEARGLSDRRSPRRMPTALRRSVPIRTYADWNAPPPGFMEIDLVAHCGEVLKGAFVHTLTMTDIASGWTECVPLVVRDSALVIEAIDHLQPALPFAAACAAGYADAGANDAGGSAPNS
jgi:hypothetical protein